MVTAFPAPTKLLRKHDHELTGWSVDEDEAPLVLASGRTITIRTHEFVVAPDTPFFRFLAIFNKVALVGATLALIATIGLSLYFSVVLLDNLKVVNAMQSQQTPGVSAIQPNR